MTPEEKELEQADIIIAIGYLLETFDIEYCRKSSKEWQEHANRQESRIVLNPGYPLIKIGMLKEQSKALEILCNYAESINKVKVMRKELEKHNENVEKIVKLFR